MTNHLQPDGSLIVRANPIYFVLSGIRSAAVGAALWYAARNWFGADFVAWPIALIFGVAAAKALIQGLFVPSLLTLQFGEGFVEGPKAWWVFRERVANDQIDWSVSGIRLSRLILQHADGQQIYSRLAWYHTEDRDPIVEQINHLRLRSVASATPAN